MIKTIKRRRCKDENSENKQRDAVFSYYSEIYYRSNELAEGRQPEIRDTWPGQAQDREGEIMKIDWKITRDVAIGMLYGFSLGCLCMTYMIWLTFQ